MKKITSCALLALVVLMFSSVGVHAQTAAPTDGPALISPGPVSPPITPGFVQFNTLTVQSVAATVSNTTGVITATGASTCLRFNSESDAQGESIACPMQAQTAPGTPTAVANGSTSSTNYMPVPPVYQNTVTIEVSPSTQLILRDRTQASLSDFSQGDQINVFGYYNADGSIQAYLVRDISKPAETQTMQLDNVTLVSIAESGVGTSATLAVTQAVGSPCLGFDANSSGAAIACPMGVSDFSANPATANVTAPSALAPNWMMLHKYVVTVDSRTIILDRNRNQLSLSSLNTGDMLNVYGESSDNGQTITADIIRDLSLPVTASAYTGTVTAINADGSFVIKMNNGSTVTVENPITVGATVTVRGLMSSLNNTISSVSQITIGNSTVSMPPMIPVPAVVNPTNQ